MDYSKELGVRLSATTWMAWDSVHPETHLKSGSVVTRCKLKIREGMAFLMPGCGWIKMPQDVNKILMVDFYADGQAIDHLVRCT